MLLAVSGGVDSSVMADVIYRLKESGKLLQAISCEAGDSGVFWKDLRIGVAHVNFHLRGEDSNRDQEFVRNLALRYGFEFFTADFDTLAYAKEHKLSVEIAARELRYGWFRDLAKKEGFNLLLTAHNANDNAETLLLNLVRGTGRQGLGGIRPYGPLSGFENMGDFFPANVKEESSGNGSGVENMGELFPALFVARPLLEVERSEIEEYARENKLEYCIDRTNSQNEYSRNKIRNQVIPLLQEINPSVIKTLTKDIEKFRVMNSEMDSFYGHKFEVDSERITSKDSGSDIWHIKRNTIVSALRKKFKPISIDRSYLYQFRGCDCKYVSLEPEKRKEEFLLNELLCSKGICLNESSIKEIVKGLFNRDRSEETRCYSFGDYSITEERGELKIYRTGINGLNSVFREVSIDAPGEFEFGLFGIKVEEFDVSKDGVNPKPFIDKGYSVLDAAKVSFPLTISKMQPGDRFSPFGLKGSKSVADFLNSRKVDLLFKDIIPVIKDKDGKIVCLPSLEIDDHFKVTSQSNRILIISAFLK